MADRRIRLGERDVALLQFAAQHRLILAAQARAVLELTERGTEARLRALCEAGLLEREPIEFRGRPACFLITSSGLKMIGSRLPKPKFDLAQHAHDVGLGWLYLAAGRGKFGPATRVLSERDMRSHVLEPTGRVSRTASGSAATTATVTNACTTRTSWSSWRVDIGSLSSSS